MSLHAKLRKGQHGEFKRPRLISPGPSQDHQGTSVHPPSGCLLCASTAVCCAHLGLLRHACPGIGEWRVALVASCACCVGRSLPVSRAGLVRRVRACAAGPSSGLVSLAINQSSGPSVVGVGGELQAHRPTTIVDDYYNFVSHHSTRFSQYLQQQQQQHHHHQDHHMEHHQMGHHHDQQVPSSSPAPSALKQTCSSHVPCDCITE
jgi:hypothetical protein